MRISENEALQIAKNRVRKVLENNLAKLLLVIMFNAKATTSGNRITLTELERRSGIHRSKIWRLIAGEKRHKSVLQGFVHYPDKGRRKGFYLLKAGLVIAEALAMERSITNRVIKKAASALAERKSASSREVPNKLRSSSHQVPNKFPLSSRFPNTLNPCNPINPASLHPAGANEMPNQNFKFSASKEIVERSKPKECERCGKKVSATVKFKLSAFAPITRQLLELAPQAARYNCAQVCDACERELRLQAIEALKALGYGMLSSEVSKSEAGRDVK